MCCQIFHKFSFKFEHDFSSVTFYICQWGASAVCPLWTPVQGVLLSGEREEASGLGRGPTWGGGEGRGCGCASACPTPGSLCTPTRWPWLLTPADVLLISLRGLLCHKEHTVGGLNHRHLSHSPGDWPGDWKSKIEVWAGLGPWGLSLACGRRSPPCVLMGSSVCLSLCPDLLFLQGPLLWGVRARLSTAPPRCSLRHSHSVLIQAWGNRAAHKLKGFLVTPWIVSA